MDLYWRLGLGKGKMNDTEYCVGGKVARHVTRERQMTAGKKIGGKAAAEADRRAEETREARTTLCRSMRPTSPAPGPVVLAFSLRKQEKDLNDLHHHKNGPFSSNPRRQRQLSTTPPAKMLFSVSRSSVGCTPLLNAGRTVERRRCEEERERESQRTDPLLSDACRAARPSPQSPDLLAATPFR